MPSTLSVLKITQTIKDIFVQAFQVLGVMTATFPDLELYAPGVTHSFPWIPLIFNYRKWNHFSISPKPISLLFRVKIQSSLSSHFYSNEEKAAAAAAMSLQSCPTLCNPIDGSSSCSTVPGILQARILEWVAISFSSA